MRQLLPLRVATVTDGIQPLGTAKTGTAMPNTSPLLNREEAPSGTVIRQGDSRFNSNIRQWGCAFMRCCWCGGINSIDGCNAQYNRAVSNGWMRSDCYINNWDSMKNVANAKSYRYAGVGERPASNQKEILETHYGSGGMHFVVGNGNGGITYDPVYAGFVSYSQATSKRFYSF